MVKEETMFLRDPIHGFIRIGPLENRIIRTKYFRRLSFVKQLGFTSYLYPGAEHTRFTHSMGVMHLAEKILNYLVRNDSESEILNTHDIEKLRLAALLHDVGHPPFSHSLEEALKDKEIYGENANHENYTKTIIKTSIRDILERESFNPEEIVDIILSKSRKELFNQLISGEIDADRMDYLLRDSMYCGVTYGIYDLDRLLVMLRQYKGSLVVHILGLEAIELFLLARLYMYIQVYNYAPVKGYDIMACKVFKELMKMNFIDYPRPEPGEIEAIIDRDDIWFFSKLREIRGHIKGRLRKLIEMILYRKSLKMVEERRKWVYIDPEQKNGTKEREEAIDKVREEITGLKNRIIEKTDLEEEDLFTHFPEQEISKFKPYIEYDSKMTGKQIKILDEKKNIKSIFEEEASILPRLASMELIVGCLYTFPKFEDKVKKAIKTL